MADSTHLANALYFETTAPGFAAGDFHITGMRGNEALSTLYEFELDLTCTLDGGIDPDGLNALLDATAQIGFGPSAIHRVSGVLKEIRLVDMEANGQVTYYRATLVPRFWLATLARRSRAFNELSVPDIIRAVLGEMQLAEGTDFELRLQGTYPVREYVVQYEESDFAFLCRWMERLGMFYCFENTDAGDKLVIADVNAELVAAPDNAECIYSQHAQAGAVGSLQGLTSVHRKMPEKVEVRDYNWRTPANPVRGEHDVDADFGTGLQAFYGGHFKDDSEGATRAELRAQEWLTGQHNFQAWSVNPDFAPGYRVTLTGAPIGELDGEYILAAVRHTAEQESQNEGSGDYRNDVDLIPFSAAFRAPRLTPWPRIAGIMHGKIDAEAVSSAAPICDMGRYRVVTPFDLYGEFGGKATRWIRKSEPYSGPAYGMHFTLHVGAEVVLAHLDGDPDRPIILGSVPNPTTGSPLTAGNATRSAIRTRSGILIDFEDDA